MTNDLDNDSFFKSQDANMLVRLYLNYLGKDGDRSSVRALLDKRALSPEVKEIVLKVCPKISYDDFKKFFLGAGYAECFSFDDSDDGYDFFMPNTNLFEAACDSPKYTKTNPDLYKKVFGLLKAKAGETVANFYGDPREFFSAAARLPVSIHAVSFCATKTEWLSYNLLNDVYGTSNKAARLISSDLKNPKEKIERRFSKIYAFPPIYQAPVEGSPRSDWDYLNMERSKNDKTEFYIQRALDCLEEGGRAVVLVSNALFSRNYKALHRKFIEQKNLSQVIHLPLKSITPKDVSASLLVFEKRADLLGIKFIDERNKDKREIYVPYELIQENNCELNAAFYKDEKASKKAFMLGEEALIAKSAPSASKVIFAEGKNAAKKVIGRYLRISDIGDGRVQNTMRPIVGVAEGCKFDPLEPKDIVLAKVIPIKIALVPSGEKIFPAESLFIVRIKPGSRLNPCYLKSFLESQAGQESLEKIATGGRMKTLSKGALETLEIPFMPQSEQKEFEAKYMALEKRLLNFDKQIEDLRAAQKNLL